MLFVNLGLFSSLFRFIRGVCWNSIGVGIFRDRFGSLVDIGVERGIVEIDWFGIGVENCCIGCWWLWEGWVVGRSIVCFVVSRFRSWLSFVFWRVNEYFIFLSIVFVRRSFEVIFCWDVFWYIYCNKKFILWLRLYW